MSTTKQRPYDINEAILRGATLHALRERVGMSQRVLAELVSVSERSVMRWESHTGDGYCPDDVLETMYDLLDKQDDDVNRAVELAQLVLSTATIRPDTVVLPYYPNQTTYIECHADSDGYYGFANATLRAIAVELERLGLEVEWKYATPEFTSKNEFGWVS